MDAFGETWGAHEEGCYLFRGSMRIHPEG